MLDIYCIGTALFGALMGYFFGWSVKQQKPNTDEITMLLSTVLGGTVTSMLAQFHCAAALPVYIVGVVVGVALYFVLLRFNWPSISDAMDNGALERPPVMPWRVPAVVQKPSEPAHAPECPCVKTSAVILERIEQLQAEPIVVVLDGNELFGIPDTTASAPNDALVETPCLCSKNKTEAEGAKLVPATGPITPRVTSDSVTFGYDSNGRLQTVTYANGTVITYNYDAMGNRTSVVTTCSGGGC